MKEVWAGESLCEDVGDVVAGPNPCDSEFAVGNEFPNGVVLHSDMFDLQMPYMVFSQVTCGIIVTV